MKDRIFFATVTIALLGGSSFVLLFLVDAVHRLTRHGPLIDW